MPSHQDCGPGGLVRLTIVGKVLLRVRLVRRGLVRLTEPKRLVAYHGRRRVAEVTPGVNWRIVNSNFVVQVRTG